MTNCVKYYNNNNIICVQMFNLSINIYIYINILSIQLYIQRLTGVTIQTNDIGERPYSKKYYYSDGFGRAYLYIYNIIHT